MKSHGKSKAVLTAVIFEVNLLQSSRSLFAGNFVYTFYGNDNAYINEWAFKVGPSIITFLELVDTSEYSLYF